MSRRLQVRVSEEQYEALAALATLRHLKTGTLAVVILAEHLQSVASGPPSPPPAAADPMPSPPPAPATQAAWLQRDRGSEWLQEIWDIAQQLREWYPDLHDATRDDWHSDRFSRDGVFALAIWRKQLDEAAENDPRLELQWLAALRDFSRNHEEHRRCRPTPGRQQLPVAQNARDV
ncbi:hypothetical protein DSM112329_02958 [Paraconexibacter sp. AEG42_29]|uniref:CopG family transcriptional regulator n=1 Tax=Paraconexibacter sp. AEG42_29 TaxID=2997339 RepID=A0AAU7AWX5_9ACTN